MLDKKITEATLVGDDSSVNILQSPPIGSAVCTMLFNLLCSYYVWDLCYPKQYQLLVFLQLHLLKDEKDKTSLFKSSAYIKFEKLFLGSKQQ